MSSTAIATLQTPWDCKWSRFGRVQASNAAAAEGLWVCVYEGTRRAIDDRECETCPHWEFAPAATLESVSPAAPATATDRIAHAATPVAACACVSRAEKRLEAGVRVAALLLAVIFAATGFVVLTGPLAIPLTITLWFGALTCFLLGIWGNFNRRFAPERSW